MNRTFRKSLIKFSKISKIRGGGFKPADPPIPAVYEHKRYVN